MQSIETYNIEGQTYCEVNVDESEMLETKDSSYVFTWDDRLVQISLYEMLLSYLEPIPQAILVLKHGEFEDRYKIRRLEISQGSSHEFILKFIRH